MESLIPLMNQIHKIFGYENMNNQLLDLPQIAVVGAQSVGKTSVIESLVKRDILPRGTGFVTRRPLMIQLNHVNEKQEYAEFNHLPGTKLIDLIGVKEEIERETERTVGKNNISSEIIYLNIFSSKVINLTLIDLPGIIKVPVQDQPQDIEIQIKNIILQFISKQNCIILALTAGNTDIANSDSLKLARDVDPSGTRTIGVITKCDTIEDGFDALDSILGKLYPLKLGYIGVVCRNQKQTLEKKSIEDSLKYEDYFFSNHPKYSRVKGGYGIPNLADKLNKFLVSSILNSIPEIKSRITNLLFETENELKFYEQPFQSEEDSGALLLNIFTHFSKYFEEAIDGKLSNQPSEELYGGARINFIFHDWYSKVLNDYNLDYAVSDTEILTTLRNASGINSTLFFPYPAFEILVKKQILLLETPSLKCVEQVYLELKNIVNECDLSAMKRFTHLKESIFTVVNNALERLLAPTNKMIHNIIQMQTAYINTNHPEFLAVKSLITSFNSENSNSQIQSDIENISPNIDSHLKQKITRPSETIINDINKNNDYLTISNDKINNSTAQRLNNFLKGKFFKDDVNYNDNDFTNRNSSNLEEDIKEKKFVHDDNKVSKLDCISINLPKIPQKIIPSNPPSDYEIKEIYLARILINSYFNIVRRTIADCVPKAIIYFMVNKAKEIINRQLVAKLYRESLFNELLKENDMTIQNRAYLKNFQSKLKNTLDILNNLPDFCYDVNHN